MPVTENLSFLEIFEHLLEEELEGFNESRMLEEGHEEAEDHISPIKVIQYVFESESFIKNLLHTGYNQRNQKSIKK